MVTIKYQIPSFTGQFFRNFLYKYFEVLIGIETLLQSQEPIFYNLMTNLDKVEYPQGSD